MIEPEETEHSRCILDGELVHGLEETVHGLQKPLVHLHPLGRKVKLDEGSGYQRQLFVRILCQNHIVWVLNEFKDAGFDLISNVVRTRLRLVDCVATECNRFLTFYSRLT